MRRKHHGQHDDCFGCRVRSVRFGYVPGGTRSQEAARIDAEEKRWEQDIPAYRSLRKQGYQPPRIDGSYERMMTATEPWEIEGRVKPDPSLEWDHDPQTVGSMTNGE